MPLLVDHGVLNLCLDGCSAGRCYQVFGLEWHAMAEKPNPANIAQALRMPRVALLPAPPRAVGMQEEASCAFMSLN
jgi:hypothetical protein